MAEDKKEKKEKTSDEKSSKKDIVDTETGEILKAKTEPKIEPFLDDDNKKIIDSKLIRLKPLINEIDKKYTPEGTKKRSMISVASSKSWYNTAKIPTGVFAFDVATYGGIPIGKITEFYGDESASKTTMALRVCGQAQKMGLLPAFVDVEQTFDETWSSRFADLDNMLLTRPESGEEALEIVDALIRSGETDLIVLDSIAAMAPQVEIDKAFEDVTVGALARLVNKAFRKWVSSMQFSMRNFEKPVTILYIQQLRQKIGVLFGNPDTVPGGNAQRFAKSLSAKMWHGKVAEDKETGKPLSVDMNFRIPKSKVCPPNMAGTYTMLLHDTEYKKTGDIIEEMQVRKLAVKYSFIEKMGTEYQVRIGESDYGIAKKLEDIDELFLKYPFALEFYKKELLEFLISL